MRKVLANAGRSADGRFLDANTGQPITGQFHIGHVFGKEWWRLRDQSVAEGWSRARLNDELNDPDLYQIEDPIENMSHRWEMPR